MRFESWKFIWFRLSLRIFFFQKLSSATAHTLSIPFHLKHQHKTNIAGCIFPSHYTPKTRIKKIIDDIRCVCLDFFSKCRSFRFFTTQKKTKGQKCTNRKIPLELLSAFSKKKCTKNLSEEKCRQMHSSKRQCAFRVRCNCARIMQNWASGTIAACLSKP